MKDNIKAIPTSYKGIKFRSKLEARWAKLLDSFGWEWDYEPQGYTFEDGTCYLPDFKVKCNNCGGVLAFDNGIMQTVRAETVSRLDQVRYDKFWLEIKPNLRLSLEEQKKIYNLTQEQKMPVFIGADGGEIYLSAVCKDGWGFPQAEFKAIGNDAHFSFKHGHHVILGISEFMNANDMGRYFHSWSSDYNKEYGSGNWFAYWKEHTQIDYRQTNQDEFTNSKLLREKKDNTHKLSIPEKQQSEIKTRRVQLVFMPTMYRRLLKESKLHGYPSFNDFCTTILGAYLEEGDDE